MQFKTVKFAGSDVDVEQRTFEGYAAAYGNVDTDNDIIERGAFAKSIQEGFPSGRIKVLWQHRADMPIGLPIEMREDDRGLYVKARISRTEKGEEALQLMRDGVIDRMSVGFSIPGGKAEVDKAGVRHIYEGKLYEFSVVTWPANDQAVITGVKTLKELREMAEQELSAKARNELLFELDSVRALLSGEPPIGTRAEKPPVTADQLKALIDQSLGAFARFE
jgi:uncharacterized protein